MARPARLASVFVAAFVWSAVVLLLVDWSGVLRAVPDVSAATAVNDDPCALRQFLPAGTDARCEFPVARPGAAPLVVELVQTWEPGTPAILVQHLRVREQGGRDALLDMESRTAGTLVPWRVLRLASLPAGPGEDHIVYVVGNCGGTACGQNNVVVLGWDGGALSELLRRRIGTTAEVELADARLTLYDGTGRGVGGQRSERMLRTFIWIGGVYAEIAYEPVPTLPPP